MTDNADTKSTVPPVQISEGRLIQAAVARVWSVVGDFGNEHKWASQLKHCQRNTETVRVGSVRSCTLAKPLMGRAAVEEVLIDYEPGKTLSYRLRGAAGPFRSAEGRWTLRADANGTFVEVGGHFQPRNAFVAVLFGRLARAVAVRAARRALHDLADYVEIGEAAARG